MTAVTTKKKEEDENSAKATAKRIKALLRVQPQDESLDAARLDELRKIFARLIGSKELIVLSDDPNDQNASASNAIKQKWNEWLQTQHDEYLEQLQRVIHRKSTLRTFFGVIASSPTFTTGRINGRLVQKLVMALVQPKNDDESLDFDDTDDAAEIIPDDLLQMLTMEFMNPYQDVKYFFLIAIHNVAKTNKKNPHIGVIGENLVRLLLQINVATSQEELNVQKVKHGSHGNYLLTTPLLSSKHNDDNGEEEEEESDFEEEEDDGEKEDEDSSSSEEDDEEVGAGAKKRKRMQRRDFVGKRRKMKVEQKKNKRPSYQALRYHLKWLQESWLQVLRLPNLPIHSLKLALQYLPTNVLPIVASPLRFADFCIRAYDTSTSDNSDVTCILALHSLYYLMLEHGLEYPNFYSRLYTLVTPSIFYTKHRTRFFKLLSNCLMKSQLLPAYMVAAFCKRLCRCALVAPPSGSLFVLALASNLLRKHGECACLIHRSNGTPMEDVYDSENNDPAACRALESSLWELNALERHYHPAVSTLAKACGMEDDKTTPYYNMDEFMIHTYKSLFEQERNKKQKKNKKTTPLTFHEPKSLFITSNGQQDLFGSILLLPSNNN